MNRNHADQPRSLWTTFQQQAVQKITGQILNFISEQDAITRKKLTAFQGMIIKVQCTAPAFIYYIIINSDNLFTLSSEKMLETMGIQGTLTDLIALVLWLGKADTTEYSSPYKSFSEESITENSVPVGVRFTGEKKQLLALLSVIKSSDSYWEGWLAEKIPSLLAHTTGASIKKTLQYLRQRIHYGRLNITEYLQEESADLLPAPLFSRLHSDASDLNKQLNLLDQRISILVKQADLKNGISKNNIKTIL